MKFEEFTAYLCDTMPDLIFKDVECPSLGPCYTSKVPVKYDSSIINMIIHLNDYHGESREFIADWLEVMAVHLDIDLRFPVPES